MVAELGHVLPEMQAGNLRAGGIAPLDLGEAGQGVTQVGDIQGALGVVVREVALRSKVMPKERLNQMLDEMIKGEREIGG